MLVLTRKTGQRLIIGNNIEVTVLDTRGDTVKLGIEAPKSITIFREEIYEEIKKANQQSLEQLPQTGLLDEACQLLGNQGSIQPPSEESLSRSPI